MNLEELAKTLADCDYEHLPDEVEIPIHVRYQFRHVAVQSKQRGQEASAILVADSSKTEHALSLTGTSFGHQDHASADTSEAKGPLQFAGTFHTHLAAAGSVTVTSESVKDFGPHVQMHDGSKAVPKDDKATKTTAPLAHSLAGVMRFVKPCEGHGHAHFSFLFCLPSTLYMLVWAKDSTCNADSLRDNTAKHAFEVIFLDVVRQTFGATQQDSIDIGMDDLARLIAQHCLPLTTVVAAGQSCRFGVYSAHVSLDGLDETSFDSNESSVQTATHDVIHLKRLLLRTQ